MLDKIMWNIFKETGNIYAYLYVKECDESSREFNEYSYNKDEENNFHAKRSLEMNGITITT